MYVTLNVAIQCMPVYNGTSLFTAHIHLVLSLRFEMALMHIPYTVEFINKKITNRIEFLTGHLVCNIV